MDQTRQAGNKQPLQDAAPLVQWLLLALLSAALAGGLEMAALPAAWLIGPMLAASPPARRALPAGAAAGLRLRPVDHRLRRRRFALSRHLGVIYAEWPLFLAPGSPRWRLSSLLGG